MRTLRWLGTGTIVVVLLALTLSLWQLSNQAELKQLLASGELAGEQFRLRFEASVRERLVALSTFPALASQEGGVAPERFPDLARGVLDWTTGYESLLLVGADGQVLAAAPRGWGEGVDLTPELASWLRVAGEAWHGARLTGVVLLPGRRRGLVTVLPVGAAGDGAGARRYIVGVLSVQTLVRGLVEEALDNDFGIRLRDDRDQAMFEFEDADEETRFDPRHAIKKDIVLGQQRIFLSVHPYKASRVARDNVAGYVILALGTTLALAIGGIFWGVQARAETLERMVRERTLELEEKHRELELEHERSLEASRLKSEFLANMTHELKSPIHSILTLAGLLAEGITGDLNAEQGKQVDFIRRSGDDLLVLIEQILTSARLEADKIEIVPAPTDVGEVLRSLAESSSPLVVAKSIDLEVEVEPSLAGPVSLDEEKFRLVAGNLLSNAIKFTPSGGTIRLRAAAEAGAGPGAPPRLRLSVQDTGIGIDRKDQGVIFDEFRQVDGSITRRFGGTGLGLSIARKLAERMDGGIEVESELGVGSTFVLSLPLAGPGRAPPGE